METRWVISIYIGHHTKNKCGLKLTSFTSHVNATCLSKGLPLKERLVKSIVRTIHTGTTNQLGYYLAGLIEGDGSIILRKGQREKISPKIVFTFGKNEVPMYEKLQNILNTGVIYSEKKKEYVDIVLLTPMGLLMLLTLLMVNSVLLRS